MSTQKDHPTTVSHKVIYTIFEIHRLIQVKTMDFMMTNSF